MRILEENGRVKRGEINAGDLPGSTTERMTIGLALNALEKTNPSYPGDKKGAWQMLDACQRQIVRDFNKEYRKKKWLTEEDIEDAGINACLKETMRLIDLEKGGIA